jgi:hypothetical protein
MVPAVSLNNQSFFKADKVDDERPDLFLAAELVPIQLPAPQMPPQETFRISGTSAQNTGSFS